MRFTAAQRAAVSADAVGRMVASFTWEPEGAYWVMTFVGGAELCVRLVAEQTYAYTDGQRAKISDHAVGRIVSRLAWDPEDEVWELHFDNDEFLVIQFMAELI